MATSVEITQVASQIAYVVNNSSRGSIMRRNCFPLLSLLVLASGCGKNEAPAPTQPASSSAPVGHHRSSKIPAEVSYPIINDERDKFPPNFRRLVDVRLNMRVTEEALRDIALEIKNSIPEQYERTMISYYLPEEVLGVKYSPWASTHFMPELEVNIYGLTVEDETKLRGVKAEVSGDKIGSWIVDMQYGGRLAIIYEDAGPKLAQFWPKTAPSRLTPMVELPADSGRRFQVKGSTDVYEVDQGGVLRITSGEGRVFAGAFPLK